MELNYNITRNMIMSDNLFSRLGFRVGKPVVEVEVPEAVKKANVELSDKRKVRYAQDAIDAAEMYHAMLPEDFIKELMKHNDYLCLQWGGRKVARLINLCRNILDIEILTDGTKLEESDRADVLRLLVLMCWMFPIPLKQHFKMGNVEKKYRDIMISWLATYGLVKEFEAELVLKGVFEGVMAPENPVLNIFHDALRYEEAQFGYKLNFDCMRTELGKNKVFGVHAQKSSQANFSPHWMHHIQDMYGVQGLVDVEKAMSDEDSSREDGISS